MVFNVSIPDGQEVSSRQREQLEALSETLVTKDGRRGRYRTVRVGSVLLVSLDAESEADARRVIAAILEVGTDTLKVTARDSA